MRHKCVAICAYRATVFESLVAVCNWKLSTLYRESLIFVALLGPKCRLLGCSRAIWRPIFATV